MTRPTLGDYLSENRPTAALWSDMVDLVFRDSPTDARLERIAPVALTLFDAKTFEAELNNGGFRQFFENSSGQRARQSLEALRAIGAAISVELLEKALTLFPNGVVPGDSGERIDWLSEFDEKYPEFLGGLSRQFYRRVHPIASAQEENLDTLALDFMREHPNEPVAASARAS